MRAEQTVNEMAQEVLWRQAMALAQRTGEPLVEALEAVVETPAGMQLEELRCGPPLNSSSSIPAGVSTTASSASRSGSPFRPARALACLKRHS